MKEKKKEYLMANIQVVSFQKRLLKPADYETLLGLSNWSEIRQQLSEYQASLPAHFPTIEEVDQFYRLELQKVRDEISRLAVDDEELSLLFVRKTSVFQVIEGSIQSLKQVDESILAQYVQTAALSPSELIRQFAMLQLDAYFLNRYLREERPILTWSEYAKGHLGENEWAFLYHLPKDKGIAWLQKSVYHKVFVDESSTAQYLQQIDRLNWELLKTYRYQVRGIEGIFVYLYEKISELYNLRLLLKGKVYRLSEEELKAKMRWLYV